MLDLARYRLQFFFAILIFVISGTFFAIKFAQGYRIDLSNKTFRPTGLLVVTSTPPGAQVLINGQLKTATDNTLSLTPGKYWVEIKKTGFLAWKKELTIEKELVTQADAFLFPQVPDLKPLTFQEVQNPQLSPDGSRVVYSIPLPYPEAGLWVMDLTDFFFNLGREPRQISRTVLQAKDLSRAEYFWSPDSKQISTTFTQTGEKYLLDSGQLNSLATLANVAASWTKTAESWQKEVRVRQEAKLKKLPEEMQNILKLAASQATFSPDGTKVLFVATGSAEIPEKLIPPVLAASTQEESRKLTANKVYVYDLKEDKNFLIPFAFLPTAATPTPKPAKKTKLPQPTPIPYLPDNNAFIFPRWFPTSRHLYWIADGKVMACEYDGTNLVPAYAGPFIKPFAFVSPSANRLIILTQVTTDSEAKPNLYSVSLR
jgi:hypothetical protein